MKDETNNEQNEQNVKRSNTRPLQSLNQFGRGINSGRNRKDIDAINKRGRNNPSDMTSKRNIDEMPNRSKEGLPKKDVLNNAKKNVVSQGTKKVASEGAKKVAGEGVKKAATSIIGGSPLKMKILLWVAGAGVALLGFVILFAFLAFAYNSLTSSITSFFGVSEKGLDDDSEDVDAANKNGLYTDDKYHYVKSTCDVKNYDEKECACDPEEENCKELGWEELVNVLYSDNTCKVDSSIYRMWDSIKEVFTGDRFQDECALLRYVRGTIKDYEDKFNVELDVGLILTTIFYGYDQQAYYRNYKTNVDNVDFTSGSEYYQVLINIVKDGKLTRSDIDRIIRNTIFEEVYPYWTWRTWTDVLGRKHGSCDVSVVQNYKYSSDKWKMFIRWNDELSDEADRDGFSVPGYIGLQRSIQTNPFASSKMLDRFSSNVKVSQVSKLYGSGYTYDTNMNNSYIASSDECNGTYTASELKKMYELDTTPNGVEGEDGAYTYFSKRGVTGTVDTTHYFQHIEDTSGYKKDEFTPKSNVKYVKSNGELKEYTIKYNYNEGFGYFGFPGFKKAIEDDNTDIEYDDAVTPKEIETIIEEIMDKKTQVNEVLLEKDMDNPLYGENGTYDENGNYIEGIVPNTNGVVTTNANCKPYLTADLSNINVTVKDCDGAVLGTVGFKDYIIGVTKGEIDNYKNTNYTLTAMIAEISYTLNRRNNYAKGSTISMRSGNCDQVFSSPAKGSHAQTATINCGRTFKCTSYLIGPSSSGKYYKGPMSASEYAAYSAIYDEASKYLVIEGGKVKSTGYLSSTQNRWKSMANSGANFAEMIKTTYPNADLIKCYGGE